MENLPDEKSSVSNVVSTTSAFSSVKLNKRQPQEKTYWSLPEEMKIEIIKKINNTARLNFLVAFPNELPAIAGSWTCDPPKTNKHGQTYGYFIESHPSATGFLAASPFSAEPYKALNANIRLFGVHHEKFVIRGIESLNEPAKVLIDALKKTNTTATEVQTGSCKLGVALEFAKALKVADIKLHFEESWKLSQLFKNHGVGLELCNSLRLIGPLCGIGEGLIDSIAHFPPVTHFVRSFRDRRTKFAHIGDIFALIAKLTVIPWKKDCEIAKALMRLVDWTFEIEMELLPEFFPDVKTSTPPTTVKRLQPLEMPRPMLYDLMLSCQKRAVFHEVYDESTYYVRISFPFNIFINFKPHTFYVNETIHYFENQRTVQIVKDEPFFAREKADLCPKKGRIVAYRYRFGQPRFGHRF